MEDVVPVWMWWSAYCGFSMIALFVLLVAVGGFLLDEDDALFSCVLPGQHSFVWRVIFLLGPVRTLLWIVVAALWPLFLALLVIAFLVWKYIPPARIAVILGARWFFLGFGKFTKPKRKPLFMCGND